MNKKGAYLLWAWFCLSYMPKPCLNYLIIYFLPQHSVSQQ